MWDQLGLFCMGAAIGIHVTDYLKGRIIAKLEKTIDEKNMLLDKLTRQLEEKNESK